MNGPAEAALAAAVPAPACPDPDVAFGLLPGASPGGVCAPPPLDGESEPRGVSRFVTVDVTAVVV
jgi:hypothetical protein